MRGKIKEALEKELELQEELKEADEDRLKRDKNILDSTTRNQEQKSRDLVTSGEKFKKESDKINSEIDVVRRQVDDLLNLSAKAIETMGLEMGENPFFDTIIGSGTGDELSKLDDLLKEWYEKRIEAETESELELLNLKEQFAIKEATQLGATKEQLLDIERYFQIERYKLEKEGLERVEKAKKGAIVDASIERKTELQLWAEKELDAQKEGWQKELKALGAALKKRQELKEKANEIEAKIAQQREDFLIDAAIGTLFASFDLMDAEYQKQITLEQNKTNALNNELKLRLQNENLSKNEREKIQNQIAQNDEKLRIKQEEIERKRFKLNKAAQISNALINTASMVLKAADLFKFPSPAGIAAIALSSAMGAAQIAAISKQKFQTSAMANPAMSNSGASGGTVQAPDFNIVGASQTNQIAAAIQSVERKPLKAYVVSKDVSSAQEMDRNIVQTASI